MNTTRRAKRILHGIALAGLLVASAKAAALTPQEVFKRAERDVLVLEVLNDKGDVVSTHTALVMEKQRAVTRCDSVEGMAKLHVVQGATRYDAQIAQRDVGRNLCTLSVNGMLSGPVAERATQIPGPATVVYALSNALGLGISISQGVVAGIRKDRGDSYIQFTAPLAPGSEGGGLYDESGRLIGIINYRKLDGQNVNFAVPAFWLNEIASRATSNAEMPAWHGKTMHAIQEKNWQATVDFATSWSKALPDSTEPWVWLGYGEAMQGHWPQAEQAYREALRREPNEWFAATELSRMMRRQGKPQAALDIANAALTIRREQPEIWLAIGISEHMLQHAEAAKQAFSQVLQLDPWNIGAQHDLAELASEKQNWAEMAQRYSRISQLDPQDEMVQIHLARAYTFDNRPARAVAVVDAMLARNTTRRGDALLWRGAALMTLGRYKEAIVSLKASVDEKPLFPGQCWEWLAQAYYSVELYADAIAAYRKSLQIDVNNFRVQGALGIALKDSGEYAQALAIFEQLQIDRPDDPLPWRQVAYTNSYLGKLDVAIPAYERALSLDPKDSKVWHALLETYHQVGRRDDVKRVYQKLTTLDQVRAAQAYREFLLPFEAMQ